MEYLRDKETDEQKEKEAIALENKMLSILLPTVGAIAFIIGLVGFILTVNEKVGAAVFLMIIAVLGLGGIGYGIFLIIKAQRNKFRKPVSEPSQEPNHNKWLFIQEVVLKYVDDYFFYDLAILFRSGFPFP